MASRLSTMARKRCAGFLGKACTAAAFAYQRGRAALLDYLEAQRDYRATQVAYINLVGSYLSAASQLNTAVGREVIQ